MPVPLLGHGQIHAWPSLEVPTAMQALPVPQATAVRELVKAPGGEGTDCKVQRFPFHRSARGKV